MTEEEESLHGDRALSELPVEDAMRKISIRLLAMDVRMRRLQRRTESLQQYCGKIARITGASPAQLSHMSQYSQASSRVDSTMSYESVDNFRVPGDDAWAVVGRDKTCRCIVQ